MKYSHYLVAADADAPPQWKGKFLHYKALKKLLKSCRIHAAQKEGEAAVAGADSDKAICDCNEATFFKSLESEVAQINREFQSVARKVIREYEGHERRSGRCCGLLMRSMHKTVDVAQLAQEAEWCRRYAAINSVGLRKIIKKHDKRCGNRRGYEFLQDIWHGSRKAEGEFLHSPLLQELKSLELILGAPGHTATVLVEMQKCADGRSDSEGLPMLPSLESSCIVSEHAEAADDAAEGGEPASDPVPIPAGVAAANGAPSAEPGVPAHLPHPSPIPEGRVHLAPPGAARPPAGPSLAARAAEGGGAAVHTDGAAAATAQLTRLSMASSGMGGDDEVDPEYVCAICLEAMYQPIGLSCGHKFCADCAFSSIGLGNALGTVKAMLQHAPPDAACPECRTVGVFRRARELKETDKLIRQRYPKEYMERAAEAKAKEARLRALLNVQRRSIQSGQGLHVMPF